MIEIYGEDVRGVLTVFIGARLQKDRKYCTKNLDTSLRSENNGDRLSVAVVYGRESVCKGSTASFGMNIPRRGIDAYVLLYHKNRKSEESRMKQTINQTINQSCIKSLSQILLIVLSATALLFGCQQPAGGTKSNTSGTSGGMQSGDSGSTQGGQQNGSGGGSSGNGGQTGGGSAGQTGDGGTGNGSGGSSGGGGQTGGGSTGQTGGVVTYTLKGTEWNGTGSGIAASLQFEQTENRVRMEMGKAETGSGIVVMQNAGGAAYTVSGTAVLFDMTAYITGLKNTTTAQYQQSEINWLKGLIAKTEEDIHKTTDPDEKKGA